MQRVSFGIRLALAMRRGSGKIDLVVRPKEAAGPGGEGLCQRVFFQKTPKLPRKVSDGVAFGQHDDQPEGQFPRRFARGVALPYQVIKGEIDKTPPYLVEIRQAQQPQSRKVPGPRLSLRGRVETFRGEHRIRPVPDNEVPLSPRIHVSKVESVATELAFFGRPPIRKLAQAEVLVNVQQRPLGRFVERPAQVAGPDSRELS